MYMFLSFWILSMGACICTCTDAWRLFQSRPFKMGRNLTFAKPRPLTAPSPNLLHLPITPPSSTQHVFNVSLPGPPTVLAITNQTKLQSFASLIRANNIAPTAFLCLSGGWIMHPRLTDLIRCPPLYASTASTLLIMSTSMIINDLCDMSIDEVNNPTRPLVTKQISVKEAVGYTMVMLGATETINRFWVPVHLQIIVHAAIANILLYTPIFKRIPIVKNLSCAILVSSAVLFAGLATATDYSGFVHIDVRAGLLWAASFAVLMGSWQNEILLDMCDREGDRAHKIYTIPAIFGQNVAWTFAFILATLNTLISTSNVGYLVNVAASLPIGVVYGSLMWNMADIQKSGYAKDTIVGMVKQTTIPLVLSLVYLGILSACTGNLQYVQG